MKFLDRSSTLIRTTVSGLRSQYEMRGHKTDESIKAVLHEHLRLADELSAGLTSPHNSMRNTDVPFTELGSEHDILKSISRS